MQGLVEGCARIETFPPGHLYDSKSGTTQPTSPFFSGFYPLIAIP